MKAALLAEWRKLTTVRSTFVLGGLILVVTALVAFFAYGFKANSGQLSDPSLLYGGSLLTLSFVSTFGAIVAILLVTHEYRYNTILHTLTVTNNRLKILFAKVAVITAYVVALTILAIVVTIGFATLGTIVQGEEMTTQNLQLLELLGRALMYSWGYATLGLIVAVLVRNQVAAIVGFLVVPSIAEGLASLILKDNIKYLPFQSLNAVIGNGSMSPTAVLSTTSACLMLLGYIAVGLVASAIMLRRRDAN